ncbi:MAG TPA: tryptophan 7-halogenase, partial [Burkholderiaceae bacterium]|nr:tryptophan 7-halogenase [Burkholderiaceae bacterium]
MHNTQSQGQSKEQKKPIRRVIIAGGGTAGWSTAAAISKVLGKILDITLIESDEIKTVGVGEATIPAMVAFHNLLEINENEFMAATQGTFKLAISFEGWRNVNENYYHAFGHTGKDHWTAG